MKKFSLYIIFGILCSNLVLAQDPWGYKKPTPAGPNIGIIRSPTPGGPTLTPVPPTPTPAVTTTPVVVPPTPSPTPVGTQGAGTLIKVWVAPASITFSSLGELQINGVKVKVEVCENGAVCYKVNVKAGP